MKLTATCSNGTLILDRNIRFRRDTVTVEIPDEEIVDAAQMHSAHPLPGWEDWEAKAIEAMPFLREVWETIRSGPEDAPDEISEKEKERWEAFELRAEYRRQHGRPD